MIVNFTAVDSRDVFISNPRFILRSFSVGGPVPSRRHKLKFVTVQLPEAVFCKINY